MAYNREWHQKHHARLQARKLERRRRNARYLTSLRAAGCSRCPEDDPRCVDFHHTDPAGKSFALGSMVARDSSLVRLQEEVNKCVLLCANCHRKEHSAPVNEVC